MLRYVENDNKCGWKLKEIPTVPVYYITDSGVHLYQRFVNVPSIELITSMLRNIDVKSIIIGVPN